ncbi:hypothetical protein C474_03375 [Halogeometricum pallidum JCM 14848]|uniref:Lipoprotein n=1 Tax=Halogeometricum pallidum JCM 14848 TaxID=1227487 RepID=M0DGP7_HALPD|nr:Hvo_1808 family surface protein [Halogeometricum pallidum]ELZ33968.1 hypothetical protein C474_03375 [Halogeometricum pallidum JCM 14848]
MNLSQSTLLSVALAALVVVSGCAAPVADPSAMPASWSWPDDPPTDRIGWEAGYWYNESIAVDQSDGLNASEREAFVARTMARVERIRGLEFREAVPVEIISRERYRSESDAFRSDPDPWQEQVYEAAFLVGENESVSDVLNQLYGGAIAGYYTPSDDRIVVVSDGETPTMSRATLAHELVHALQDQHFGFASTPPTHDGRIAANGLSEGDANYVEALYDERCSAEWDCVTAPDTEAGGGSDFDFGVYLTVYAPYSEGPQFVHSLRRRGGWDAVNAAYEDAPITAEQILHPEAYPDEGPADVTVRDRSSAAWSRFDRDRSTDRLGEVFIYTAFWDTDAIDRSSLRQQVGPYSRYNYTSNASAGWGGDELVPYRSGDGEFGYVWATEWDTERDAREFRTRYVESLLVGNLNATRVGPNVYVVEDGPFADAFRVRRSGTRVTVVNAPTVGRLDGVRAAG